MSFPEYFAETFSGGGFGADSGAWIADRIHSFDSSGIRKAFDLASKLENPINLSIGQPDFDVPQPVRQACIDAIQDGKNGYSVTQGTPALREQLQAHIYAEHQHADRKLFVASGTSGALVLALMSLVNPGDEVVLFDPFFVMYEPLVNVVGGKAVLIDTYPDFRIDVDRVAAAITSRTKLILLNSPANPTGAVASEEEIRGLAKLSQERNIALISDEIYRSFCYDEPFFSPVKYNDRTIVIDGFSKSHAMTGWRVGYAHGPAEVIDAMIKLQQYSFVCAPHPAQWGAVAALQVDVQSHIDAYRGKRNLLWEGLNEKYEIVQPGGAFYMFPRAPGDDGEAFVARALEKNLIIIPGNIFSRRNTHFRISYAAPDEVIEKGIEVLRGLA